MKALIRNLIITGILITMISCNPFRNIYTNYDKSMDFSQYQTFAWAPDSGKTETKETNETAFDNDIVRNNAKNYITHSLTQRGYMVDVDSPDLLIQLVLLDEKKERIITYYTHRYMGYYYYSPFYFPYYYPYPRFYTWYGWSHQPFWDYETTTYAKTYTKGTITVNMYDRRLKKLVWTGSAEGDIYDASYIHFDVHPAIDRIIKEFPVKSIMKEKRDEGVRPKNGIVRTNDFNGNFRTMSAQ
ncbi:MAG: DUF4136 domain-containing protein [Cyclobacteriaceae bacterium]